MVLLFIVHVSMAQGKTNASVNVANASVANVDICDEVKNVVFQGQDNWLFAIPNLAVSVKIESTNRLQELIETFDFLGVEVVFVNVPSRATIHSEKLSSEKPDSGTFGGGKFGGGKSGGDVSYYFDYQQASEAYTKTIDMLQRSGLETEHLLDYIHLNRKADVDYTFQKDTHWNSNGAALVAKAVSEVITELDSFQSMASTTDLYNIELTERRERQSDILGYVTAMCGPLEISTDLQKIYRVTNPNSTMLSDADSLSIPLWGTSYSGSVDFDDFLSFELDVDVINHSIIAGGVWQSLLSYFLNLEEDYPQIAIWEAPFWLLNELNNPRAYKEVIPTLYGSCAGDLVVIPQTVRDIALLDSLDRPFPTSEARSGSGTRSGNVYVQAPQAPQALQVLQVSSQGEQAYLHLLKNQNTEIKGNSYYTQLQFDDLSVTNFKLMYIYADGSRYVEVINRDERLRNNGKYFYELPQQDATYLTDILLIDAPLFSQGNVSAKLCKKPIEQVDFDSSIF